MAYEIRLVKEVSDWDEKEGQGLKSWITLDETDFISGTKDFLNKWLEKFGLEFKSFEERKDAENWEEEYEYSQIENAEGLEDDKGKYIAQYSLFITEWVRKNGN